MADCKCFCLLTGESIDRWPHPNTSNIEKAYQDFCESVMPTAKHCIPHGRRKKLCAMLGQRVQDPLTLLHPSSS